MTTNRTKAKKPKKTPKPRYRSRALRAGEQASAWEQQAERLRDLANQYREDIPEDVRAGILEEAKTIASSIDTGELESLKEEMRSWEENMGATSLANTGKYEEVQECADSLDNIDGDMLQSSGEDIESDEDMESLADDLESAASELSEICFPGMY